MDFFISSAWAQAQGAQQTGAGGWLLIVLMFVVFYFMLIRPQTKRAKQHREMVSALNEGDEIVTAGGVLGRITAINDQFVTLEVADGVRIKVQRHTIGTVMPKGTMKSV